MKKSLVVVFLLSACAYNGPKEKVEAPVVASPLVATYDSIDANIFKPKCYSCHTGDTPKGDEDLSDYDSLLKTGNIVSGDPDNSQLYEDVESGDMPRGAAALSPEEVQVIYDWIKNGMPKT